jgi:uncharacterized protein
VSIVNKPKIIIAAIACRPYVKAAVACGYEVVAIDAFADDDVRNLTEICYQLELRNDQLNMRQLMQVMERLDLHAFVGFCYGAGFEKEPAMLSKINELLPVLGNLELVVNRCKAPDYFFTLCDQLKVPHPEIMFTPPSNSAGWLCKEIGASGGGHIKQVDDIQTCDWQKNQAVYYQKIQQGKPVSCLFIVSNNSVQVIGFNEQFVSRCNHAPFRYGGAVSHVVMSDTAKARFEQYIVKLSSIIGLAGLNSCDAICDGDDIFLLEINPRLSATMDLYADYQLFEKHIAALSGKAIVLNHTCNKSCAHQVIYAEHAVSIKDDIIWPEWVYDRPRSGGALDEGMPVCTVVAEAETTECAKRLVNERAITISREFLN